MGRFKCRSVLTLRSNRNQVGISVKTKKFSERHSGYKVKVWKTCLEIKRSESGPNTNWTDNDVLKTFQTLFYSYKNGQNPEH